MITIEVRENRDTKKWEENELRTESGRETRNLKGKWKERGVLEKLGKETAGSNERG